MTGAKAWPCSDRTAARCFFFFADGFDLCIAELALDPGERLPTLSDLRQGGVGQAHRGPCVGGDGDLEREHLRRPAPLARREVTERSARRADRGLVRERRPAFTVLPFFWQQPWFLFAVLVVLLVGIRLLMVYRTRNMEWLNATLRAQVEERTESIEKARQVAARSSFEKSNTTSPKRSV